MPTQHYSDTRLWQWEEENQYDGLEHYNTWGCSDRVLLEFGVKSILEVVIVSALEKQSPALRTLSLCSWQTFQTSFAKCISSLSQRQCPDMLPLDFWEDSYQVIFVRSVVPPGGFLLNYTFKCSRINTWDFADYICDYWLMEKTLSLSLKIKK